MLQKPHVSPALQHLRSWVTLAATLLAVAAFVHMLVFGFVHFTDVRWTTVEAPAPATNTPTIISHPRAAAAPTALPAPNLSPVTPPAAAASSPTPASPAPMPTGATRPRVLSQGDANLRLLDTAAVTAGLICGVALTLLTFLGVLIAAGGGVPGIEKTLRSFVVAGVLGVVCLPWGQLLGRGILPGVFSTYDTMINASAAAADSSYTSAAGFSLLFEYLFMPILAVVGAAAIGWWFRSGVERGVIYTSVSEFDHRIEQEIANIRQHGAGSLAAAASGVRAVGALNQAIGDMSPPSPPPPAPIPFKAAAGAESLTSDHDITRSLLRNKARDFDRPLGTPHAGDAPKRPI